MIQGRSNFVYRVSYVPNVTPVFKGELPQIFVSKDCLEKNNEGNYILKAAYVDLVQKRIFDIMNPNYNDYKSDSEIKDFYRSEILNQIHVDVNLVNNDILDINAFISSREEYKDAMFISEESDNYICGHEVEKMSKSKYNVVTPDDIAEKFGSDTLRLYEMFLGPLEQSKPWNTNGITGVHGFLKKLWRLFYQNEAFNITTEEPTKAELKTLHKTIKKITEDIERFSFNTSVSNFMICVNELTDLKCNKKEILEPLLICLSPYAPHITEELWKQLGHTESIAFASFPLVNEAFLVDDSINYPVSVNGKLKFTLELAATLTKEEVEAEVMKNEQTIKLLAGQQPKKVIVVHKKIVNMVI